MAEKENMTEEKLRKLKVFGKGGLRDFITSNKIFSGISNLTKAQLIQDTLISEWWRNNVLKGKKKGEKVEEVEEVEEVRKETSAGKFLKKKASKELDEVSKLKQKLQNRLRECETRILKRDAEIAKRDAEILKRDSDILEKSITPTERKEAIEQLGEDIVKVGAVQDVIEERGDNIEVEDLSDIIELMPKITATNIDFMELKPEEVKQIVEVVKENIEEVIENPPASLIPIPPPAPPLPLPLEELPQIEAEPVNPAPETPSVPLENTPPSYTEGMITHKDPEQKAVDVGHTIVNVYCNGSNHPDFPVPQSVVRQALDAQQLPLFQQQQMAEFLKQQAQQQVPIQGIPPEAIPDPIPHPSHSSLRPYQKPKPASKFPPVSTVQRDKPASKFPPVKTVQRNKPVVEKEEEKQPSRFEDDDEEEETAEEAIKRKRQEEIAKEFSRAKKKGFNDKFKSKLEGIFSARIPK